MGISKLDQAVLTEYLKIQKEFVENSCKPGIEETYRDLDIKYRGDGNYVPLLLDQKIDRKTIKAALPLMKEKIAWIKTQGEILKKSKDFSITLQILKRIENDIQLLQEAKNDHFQSKTKKQRKHIEEKAWKQFKQMLKEVDNFKEAASYLLSFNFPLDHLALRAEYEKFKNVNTKEARAKANSIYLFRKIVQDGSYDDNLSRNDSTFRAAFDTLYLSLTKESDRSFLSENERADFKYILDNFKNLLEDSQKLLLNRFNEWEKRAERSFAFYQELADGKKITIEDVAIDANTLLQDRSRALYNLKEFVLKKEADTYLYWAKKSELFQFLFAAETILYAEVGRLDSPGAPERRDVTRVIINRYGNPAYNKIESEDALFRHLPKDLKQTMSRWLNVLFKEGEFSFTYFYIPGNVHIYCPDMSKTGQYLRRENIKIALDLFNNSRKFFPAVRYFSRMSMYGRIEMDSLWADFYPLKEVPGNVVKNSKKLSNLYLQDRYKYYYHFLEGQEKKTYVVAEMRGRTYVVDHQNPKRIYYYRNPHQFRYFAPVK